jgi:hypothetical protein
LEKIGGLIMPRLVKSVEKRPEEATVINWTVPVYIKNGEDYYKVCFDIKRKPLSDNSLPLTKEELDEFSKITGIEIILVELIADSIYISYRTEIGEEENGYVTDVKAILWLAERFELTSNN